MSNTAQQELIAHLTTLYMLAYKEGESGSVWINPEITTVRKKIFDLFKFQKSSLLKEIREKVKVALETYLWDETISDDGYITYAENRKRLNKTVLELLENMEEA